MIQGNDGSFNKYSSPEATMVNEHFSDEDCDEFERLIKKLKSMVLEGTPAFELVKLQLQSMVGEYEVETTPRQIAQPKRKKKKARGCGHVNGSGSCSDC